MADPSSTDRWERAAGHWAVVLTFGIVSCVLGIVMMAWPKSTVTVVAILLGLWLLVSGIFSLVASLAASGGDAVPRTLVAIAGALSILLGVLCFRGPFQAAGVLALFVGLGWLMRGLFETLAGIQAKGQPGRGIRITVGVLSIVAGIVVLAWPAPSLVALAWITGLWFVMMGIFEIATALRVRSAQLAATGG